MDTSRVWSKPELVVLGRGAPEENVLHYCKTKVECGHYGCGIKVHKIWCQNPKGGTS